jgi:hypothetical protein
MAALSRMAVHPRCNTANRFEDRAAHSLQSRLDEEIHMKKLVIVALFTFAAACSKKKPSCEDIFEHTKSIAPAEMKDMLERKKESAIEKCEKMSDEAKQCAADAKTMEDLQKCPRS